jgi:hypothetical protein
MVVMVRVELRVKFTQQARKQKADLGIRSAVVLGSDWFEAFRPRTSGLSPDPPWPLPARLAESVF